MNIYRALCCAALLTLLFGVPPLAAEEPVVARSLAQLERVPAVAPDSFDFVVTGDTQSNRQLVFQTDLFKQMIREWNVLKPALVVEVGDLILGGDSKDVPQQWDLFQKTIADIQPPYFPVPGNHDVNDAVTERMWLERMGPTRYAFSYGNSRFIVLDSEEVDALDVLSDAQVAWLKQELDTTKAKNVFIFLHQPYFTCYKDPRKMDETWARRWQYLADVMHGHPVRAVFAGHEHGYRDYGVRDGVHYVIAAGGASLGGGPDPEGRFSHYVLVRVRGEEVTWAVIKPGSILPSNIATNDRAAELFDIQHRLVFLDDVRVPYGQPCDRDIIIRILNPFEKPFNASLAWEVPEGWKVEPAAKDYSVAANGNVELPFHVSAASADAVRFPVPKFKTHYANTAFGPPVDMAIEMPLVPVAEAVRTKAAVRIDGVLDEWTAAMRVPLTYPDGFEKGKYDPADLSGECRVMWDDDNLYIAFDIVDNDHCQPYAGDIVWLADAIEFGVDRWAWGISLTQAGPEVFLYEGEGQSAETVRKDVPLAVRRDAPHTIYELALPARLTGPLVLKPGATFRLRAQVADLDLSGAKHELSLTPGGDGAPGMQVVLR